LKETKITKNIAVAQVSNCTRVINNETCCRGREIEREREREFKHGRERAKGGEIAFEHEER